MMKTINFNQRSAIADQVKAHLDYGDISFHDSKISECNQFSHWMEDSDGSEYAVFIDCSKLLIKGSAN